MVNPERGAKIAAWGTSNAVASCSSCRGYDGVGNGTSLVPRLAGQSSAYLMQQLDKYCADRRHGKGLFGWVAALLWDRPMVLACGLSLIMLGLGGVVIG
jgi:cytochrome c553